MALFVDCKNEKLFRKAFIKRDRELQRRRWNSLIYNLTLRFLIGTILLVLSEKHKILEFMEKAKSEK
jgi:hypothetical protein